MKMKKLLLVLPAILLALTMTVVGCDDSPTNKHQTNDAPQTVKYESIDASGNTYILTITEKTSRAAYTVTKGDSYALTIKQQGQPDKESKGTVSTIKDDGELTMKPTKEDSEPFGVSVNDGKMTDITGTITLEDGGKIPAPGAVTPIATFTNVASMSAWLSAQPTNNKDTPYAVKLNVSDLGGDGYTAGSAGDARYIAGSAGDALNANKDKYVILDLSDSTITSFGNDAFTSSSNLVGIIIPATVNNIPNFTFQSCSNLTRITIPNNITSIGGYAFQGCTSLTSVTFQGTITADNFDIDAFRLGDLRAKYLAGGIGTYTTTAPVDNSSVWTKK